MFILLSTYEHEVCIFVSLFTNNVRPNKIIPQESCSPLTGILAFSLNIKCGRVKLFVKLPYIKSWASLVATDPCHFVHPLAGSDVTPLSTELKERHPANHLSICLFVGQLPAWANSYRPSTTEQTSLAMQNIH